jgi:hypothetical protein
LLLGAPGLLATIACRSSLADLIPASGDQDHTLLPTARRITGQLMPLASIASRA